VTCHEIGKANGKESDTNGHKNTMYTNTKVKMKQNNVVRKTKFEDIKGVI
jgi:hypothetical protein